VSDDHCETNISSVSPMVLVEMTASDARKLEHRVPALSPPVEGRGLWKTAEAVCYEVFVNIVRHSQQKSRVAHTDCAGSSGRDRALAGRGFVGSR